MGEVLFLAAFVVLATSGHLGGKIVQGYIVNQPRDPRILDAICGFASLASIGFFIWGFFRFSWWVPLLGLPIFAVVGAWITIKAQESHDPPAIAMLLVLIGIALAGSSIVTM